jgi:hypothetical protein
MRYSLKLFGLVLASPRFAAETFMRKPHRPHGFFKLFQYFIPELAIHIPESFFISFFTPHDIDLAHDWFKNSSV